MSHTIRRVVLGHNPDGSQTFSDESLQAVKQQGGWHTGQAFHLPEYNPDPLKLFKERDLPPPGLYGAPAQVLWIDFPPNTPSPEHFTPTLDLIIITIGSLQLKLHDGREILLNAGDLFVQVAAVHQWINPTDQMARFVGICLPTQEIKVDGKNLDQPPFNFTKFLFVPP
ncbi:hypothetical protein M231_06957 [Tremella mesenterica]|uniref:Cupin type-2 domain-containing protein n=1 Tax=Tremella mesenterica TaxID=5217 RepID=A0A4Q1BFX8_TREME|nr:hypothetical protein M231_06957 [Tremella mesenterica]